MHDEHSHPGAKTYIIIGVILAIATVIELVIPNMGLGNVLQNTLLILFTIVKAGLVAGFFMHLKFDLRIYTGLFAFGMFALIIPFAIVMLDLMT